MAGVRPLTHEEIQRVADRFRGQYESRDRALFLLQYFTGRRISQTLALRIGDLVTDKGVVVREVWYRRATVKGKVRGEQVDLHPRARAAVGEWIDQLWELGFPLKEHFVFQAQGVENRALTRNAAYQIYARAFRRAGLVGRLGTHSVRKAFAQAMYLTSEHNIKLTQDALGHKSPANTARYLGENKAEIKRIIMEVL